MRPILCVLILLFVGVYADGFMFRLGGVEGDSSAAPAFAIRVSSSGSSDENHANVAGAFSSLFSRFAHSWFTPHQVSISSPATVSSPSSSDTSSSSDAESPASSEPSPFAMLRHWVAQARAQTMARMAALQKAAARARLDEETSSAQEASKESSDSDDQDAWRNKSPMRECAEDLQSQCAYSRLGDAFECLRDNFDDLTSQCRAAFARAQMVRRARRFAQLRERLQNFFNSHAFMHTSSGDSSQPVTVVHQSPGVVAIVTHASMPEHSSPADIEAPPQAVRSSTSTNANAAAATVFAAPEVSSRTTMTAGSGGVTLASSRWLLIAIACAVVLSAASVTLYRQQNTQVKPLEASMSEQECHEDDNMEEEVTEVQVVLPSAPLLTTVPGAVKA